MTDIPLSLPEDEVSSSRQATHSTTSFGAEKERMGCLQTYCLDHHFIVFHSYSFIKSFWKKVDLEWKALLGSGILAKEEVGELPIHHLPTHPIVRRLNC